MHHGGRQGRGARHRVLSSVALVALTMGLAVGLAVAGNPPTAAAATGSASAGADTPLGSVLGPGQVLAPGQSLASPQGPVVVVMQTDGNLVGYAIAGGTDRVLWASGTQGNPGAHGVMQADGNLVVYSPAGRALWSTGTAGHPGATMTVQDDGNTVIYGPGGDALWSSGTASGFSGINVGPTLGVGQKLLPGQYLQSPNGRYRLYQTPEGPPALYQQAADGFWWLVEGSDSLVPVNGLPTFFTCALCTGSVPVLPGSFLTLQADGNLVLYPPGGGRAEWSAGVAGKGGVTLKMQGDGNLVLYSAPTATGPGSAVWQTGTDRYRGTVLGDGTSLRGGQFILSPDGTLKLVMQADGNLVLYGAGLAHALWSSGTPGDQGTYLDMQDDDNLVLYGQPAPGTPSPPAAPGLAPQLGTRADLTTPPEPLWASSTALQGVDSGLTAATVGAAVPYTAWLSAAAGQAEQAAQQQAAATAAYETAFATTVPPLVVTANRVQLESLIATNFFGQNTPAIAAVEATYTEMWAQDVAAMTGYHAGATPGSSP